MGLTELESQVIDQKKMFPNIEFDGLFAAAQSFKITEGDSYVSTYQDFLLHFERIEKFTWHDVVIGSHIVYGWMPTIINLNENQRDKVVSILNDVKGGKDLSVDELLVLKDAINNSLVGASKLIHFINPEKFAIWDSRIYRYSTGRKSQYGIDKPENYLLYLKALNSISSNPQYNKLHSLLEVKFGYDLTPNRAIEVLMFELDRAANSTK